MIGPPQVRIVLVRTSHPGNIGAVARAMKTMGQSQLYLVQPKYFPHADATARASGADDLLAQALVVESLDEALAGCGYVYGLSARLRSIQWPVLDPRACAQQVLQQPGLPAALVFGNERNGLSNAEMDRCQYLVNIPTNPDFSSLNLASAVQVMVHELNMLARQSEAQARESASDLSEVASADELARLYTHLEQMLVDVEFLDPANPRHLMRRLRRLFNKATLDSQEVKMLRGILRAAQGKSAASDK